MGKLKTLIVSGRLTIEHNYRETNDRIRTLLESTGRFDVRITEEFKGAPPDCACVVFAFDGVFGRIFCSRSLRDCNPE